MATLPRRAAAGVARLRRPAYTGRNRCRPCTVLNAAIAVVASAAIARARSRPAGAVALALSALTIALRGYLVPGTPALTRRYAPEWALRTIGKRPPLVLPADLVPERIATETIARPLPPAFGRTWRDLIAARRGRELTAAAVAGAFGVPTAEPVPGGPAFVVGDALYRWESSAALLADVAAAEALSRWTSDWRDLDPAARRRVLVRLRKRLETCPACGGPLDAETERLDSCCTDARDVLSTTCRACGAAVVRDGREEGRRDRAAAVGVSRVDHSRK
ncbi:MAG: hypothetical protein ABEJ31_11085 [Haloarculaceae archaeon]